MNTKLEQMDDLARRQIARTVLKRMIAPSFLTVVGMVIVILLVRFPYSYELVAGGLVLAIISSGFSIYIWHKNRQAIVGLPDAMQDLAILPLSFAAFCPMGFLFASYAPIADSSNTILFSAVVGFFSIFPTYRFIERETVLWQRIAGSIGVGCLFLVFTLGVGIPLNALLGAQQPHKVIQATLNHAEYERSAPVLVRATATYVSDREQTIKFRIPYNRLPEILDEQIRIDIYKGGFGDLWADAHPKASKAE